MKLATLVLLAILPAASALADGIINGPQPADPAQELKPIRLAKAHIIISRMTAQTAPNPSVKNDLVCDVTVDSPVFDIRSLKGPWWLMNNVTKCASTLGTEAVEVQIPNSIELSNTFSDTDHTDRKYFGAGLWVSGGAPSHSQPVNASLDVSGVSAWSHDLGLRSVGLDLSPAVFWSCQAEAKPMPSPGPTPEPTPITEPAKHNLFKFANEPDQQCKSSLEQWFTATVEFQD